MIKNYFLSLLAIAALIAFAGCGSTDEGADLTTGSESSGGWDDMNESVESADAGSGEEVRFDSTDGRRGVFPAIHFAFDSASLSSNGRSTLNKVGDYLENNPGAKILVEGNCDQSGTAEYNRALGQRRAQAARSYLVGKGISPSRISTVSYGEDKPIGSDAQNRRDEFIVID